MSANFKNNIVIKTERNARHEWTKIAVENTAKAAEQKTEQMAAFYRLCAMNAFDKAAARGALLCC